MDGKQLKNSILQWAIQGKLVPQNPKEGSGEILFQRLKKYHGNIKPCKDNLDYSSVDFELPSNWKIVQMEELFNFVDYRGKTPNKISKGVFLITASNIKQGYMDYSRKEYISEEEYECRKSRGITRKGDLLFTTEAPMGNAALCDLDICSCGQRIITLQEYECNIIVPKLYMFFILSPLFQMQLQDNCTGTTAKGIKAEKLKHLQIPLPPLAEQKRIVAKLEQVLPLADEYGAAQEQLDKLNRELPEALKKSILQLAIQGKLVPQSPKDEPAQKLLERIASSRHSEQSEESSKRSKKISKNPTSHIYCENGTWYEQIGNAAPKDISDEIPFDIPTSWVWCRVENISQSYIGLTYKPQDVASEGTVVLRSSNIKNGQIVLDDIVRVKMELSEKYYVQENDILICARNGSKKLVGKAALIPKFDEKMTFGAFMAICKTPFYAYVYYYLMSDLFYSQLWNVSGTTTINQLTQNNFNRFLVPLPPLAEQKRIVTKLEQLFKVL